MAHKARGRQLGSTTFLISSTGGGGELPSAGGNSVSSGATSSASLVKMEGAGPAPTEETGGPPTGTGSVDVKPRTRGSSEPRTPIQTPQQQEQRFGKRGSGQAFALGLFQILKTEDPSIIGWSASGKAFRIGDSERFCRDIMPRFFKQNKYSSFQRQLNLYGFRKLVRGNEAGGYMHPLFERGKPEQLSQVRRGFFPEIPPEFAHDVHGHGLGEPTTGAAGGGNETAAANPTAPPSRAAPRGRKSEPHGHRPSGSNGSNGSMSSASTNNSGGSGAQPARSSSVGRSGRPSGMSAAAAAAAAAVAAAAAPGTTARGVLNGKAGVGGRASPPGGGAGGRMSAGGGSGPRGRVVGRHDQGHVRSGSASVVMGHGLRGDGGMAVDTDWDGVDGPLPSLDLVTSGLRLPGRHANGVAQGAGAEMPPTLGRLGDPHESSPMKRDGRMHHHRRHGSTNMDPPDRHDGHSITYGRSQDDLSVGSPRAPYSHFMGMAPHASVGDSYDRKWAAGYYKETARPGHASDYYGSNGSVASGSSHGSRRGHRPLHHMHSRDDLDALRPRKTRRTGPSYHGGHGHAADDSHSFLATSPRRDGDGAEGFDHGDGGENGIPFLTAAVSYTSPDEVPPAPPRRLVSRHNTPSRPERSGASNKNNGGSGSSIKGGGGSGDSGSGHGHPMHLGDPNAMETEGGSRPAGPGPGMGGRNRANNFAAQGFFAAVSPVAVSAAYGGFPGGRRHRRHYSSGGAQHGSGGGSALSDGYNDASGGGRTGPGWRLGEISPEEAAAMRGESPSRARSGGGGGASAGGGGMGGLGLTAHAMSRMEQVKTNQHKPMLPGDASQSAQVAYRNGSHHNNGPGAGGGPSGNGVGVQALGENLSQLDLGEAGVDGRSQGVGGSGDHSGLRNGISNNGSDHTRGSSGVGLGILYDGQRQQKSHQQHRDSSQKQQQQHQRQLPDYTQPLSSGGRSGVVGGHKRGNSGMGLSPGRRPTAATAAEAAELLRRRSSVDEVIGLLSAPAADGGFEDESARTQHHDPAQFDSWRNSLTKVLGHLGFDFEDEHGAPVQGPEGKRSPAKRISSRGTSQYLSWGGTSAMSFEEQPEEFHESLRQIPMRWRSSLSSIMTSMASNGGALDDAGGGDGGSAVGGMDVGSDGKPLGERKRLEQQASLEMLQSVMRETLESISQGAENGDAEDGEAEAKAAAAAALAMGSMCRANANVTGSGSGTGGGDRGGSLGNTGRGGGLGAGMRDSYGVSGGMRDAVVDSRSGMEDHTRSSHSVVTDAYYQRREPGRSVGHLQGRGGYRHVVAAQGNGGGGGGMQHGEHHTSF